MRSVPRWLVVGLLVIPACAAEPALPPLGSNEPASPDAPEAPLPPARRVFAPLDDDAAPSDTAPRGAWVCPMHEDVTSDVPGRCPRCRMALVQREAK